MKGGNVMHEDVFDEDFLMTVDQLAGLVGKSERTLWAWRQKKYGPPFLKIGNRILYLASDVQQFLLEQKMNFSFSDSGNLK
jgi:predicted DNA-binding transcriptional regulator AlpA